jgi:hypothetical protein
MGEAKAIVGFLGDETVFYTRKGTRFHVVNCPIVSSKSGNVTQTRRALEYGLKPCDVCRPLENVLYKVGRLS